MGKAREEHSSQDSDLVFDDEMLDELAPTRVSIGARGAFAPEPSLQPEQVRVGDTLAGKYRVERVHRRGVLGVTVEALHLQLEQRVAIRLLSADPLAYPEAVTRFLRGARQAVQFQSEHTARIIDVGTLDSGVPYFVTELLLGSDVQRVLRVREWLPVPDAVDYLLQACEALAEAHARHVVHRNLKPTNLFVTKRAGARRLVVLDFGVSDDPLTDAAINFGGISGATKALAYLAPEQIRDPGSVDLRADIWALGAILHEMLTGCVLFDASSTPGLLAMIAADPAPPVSQLRPEIPAELESVVLTCLAKEREERYGSVAALAAALRPFASATGHGSAERLDRAFAQRSRSARPPPLPGQPTRAIVRVPPPPKSAPSPSLPPSAARRFTELGLTAVGLAAAGALGVYVAIRSMEGALAAAVAPRAVVSDLSPALPAPRLADAVPPSAMIAATASVAPRPSQSVVSAPRVASRAAATVEPLGTAAPAAPPAAAVLRHAAARAAASENSVVADAKPAATKSAAARGLFDDAN
ncbi:MAG TPA: serine/threonine-protein kinase [Polyangiaceae bacterium]|nr:serine/threonine-protein kinase [Polyangiaceae bacterium]